MPRPSSKRLVRVGALILAASIASILPFVGDPTHAATTVQFTGPVFADAARSGQATQFGQVLSQLGIGQEQVDEADAILAPAHFSVDGKVVPTWAVGEQALLFAHRSRPEGEVRISDVAKAMATTALQMTLYRTGLTDGLTVSDAEIQRVAQVQATSAAKVINGPLPNGQIISDYYASTQFAKTYRIDKIAWLEEQKILGHDGLMSQGDAVTVKRWASQQFLARVQVIGLPGVSSSDLADFL